MSQNITHLIAEDVKPCSNPCTRTAVIFVHGIFGSAETWVNSDTRAFWPRMLAHDPDIGSDLDVYRVDYDSFLLSSGPSMVDILKSMEPQIDHIISDRKYTKAVIIGHSLGGNIARAYLLHVKARYGHRVLSSIRLVFSLGTPVDGSDLAGIARLASSNQQLRVISPIRVNDFQQLLNLSLSELSSKHKQVYCPPLNFYAAYEKEPVSGIGIVVSKESAISGANYIEGFDRSHVTLVKPADRQDSVYLWVKDGVSKCVRGDSVCGEQISPDCGRLPDGFATPETEPTTLLSTRSQ